VRQSANLAGDEMSEAITADLSTLEIRTNKRYVGEVGPMSTWCAPSKADPIFEWSWGYDLIFDAAAILYDVIRCNEPDSYDGHKERDDLIVVGVGFDRPVWVQYWKFASHTVQGDFGKSWYADTPAFTPVIESMPPTIYLTFAGRAVSSLPLPFGILAALWVGEQHGTGAQARADEGNRRPGVVAGCAAPHVAAQVGLGRPWPC
jgi:hypothetical protein